MSFSEKSKNKNILLNNRNDIKKNSSKSYEMINNKSNNRQIYRNNTLNKKNTIRPNDICKIKNTEMYLNKLKIKDLNDEELNKLEYEYAIIIDKRTYFQYYCSLLKKKHLILFSFYPANDYNLIAVKISLFLLSFSLYFTINGFFLVIKQ